MIAMNDIFEAKLLIVDDQPANVMLLQHILVGSGYKAVSSTTNPLEVCDLQRKEHFDLILLDLNMPQMDGFQVMAALKEEGVDDYLSVLVLTAQPDHKLRALDAGARDFVSKPFDKTEVLTRIRNMLEVRLLHKELHKHNEFLEHRVQERTLQLRESYRETIHTLASAAEHKDSDTGLHVQRISYYCRELANELGMDADFCDQIFYASPLHDVGKMAVPDHILQKPGTFTPAEWEIMKGHVVAGSDILSGGQSPYLKMGANIALNHHERWDGGGYPKGLVGDAIPLPARIMNICDIYDALRSTRPYKVAFDHARAMDIITRGDGRTNPSHFDPRILQAFTRHQHVFCEIFETRVVAEAPPLT
jgi:putative two-component system response regulator